MPRRRQHASGKHRPQRATARTPAEPLAQPAERSTAIITQVYVCAALCTVGLIAGGLRVANELVLQLATARAAVAYPLAALGIGLALGWSYPRRVIRRRLGARGAGSAGAVGSVDFEFAASLTGGLIIALGVLWVLLAGLLAGLESYRTLLTQHFVHPVWLTRGLLTLPVWGGLLVLGGMTAVVLSALHGWQRLVAPPNAGVARLWLAMLAAGALTAGGAALLGRPLVLTLLAPLATFTASVVAVLHKPADAVRSEPIPVHAVPLRRLAPALLAVALLAALDGVALGMATPTWFTTPALALGVAWLSGAAFMGACAAQALGRLFRPAFGWGSFLVLAAALVCGLPSRLDACAGVEPGLCRAVLTTVLAAASVVFASHRLGELFRRVQPTLAWIGGTTAFAAACGLTLSAAGLSSDRGALVVALAVTAGAGLGFVFDRLPGARLRTVGLAAVGLWLLLLFWHGDTPAATSGVATHNPHAASGWLTASDPRAVRVALGHDRPALPNAWDVDLGGAHWDTIIVAINDPISAANLTPTQAETLLRRCARTLRTGGRLGLEQPAGPLTDAAARLPSLGGLAPDSVAYEAQITEPAQTQTLLLIGRDIPAWLAQQPLPTGFNAQCRPWHAGD